MILPILKSVATLPYEVVTNLTNFWKLVCRVCWGIVLLKYELARDLKYARQQLLWQKQITVIGFVDVDSGSTNVKLM